MSEKITHAGGVVVRYHDGLMQYLLVSASDDQNLWVFPKGHIEDNESPEDAALREVREEAGIEATINTPLGIAGYQRGGESIHVQMFLMTCTGELPEMENRRIHWFDYEEAMKTISFEELRPLLEKANNLVQQ